VKIIPFTWDDANVQIEALGEHLAGGGTASSFGIASFPAGRRHPAHGHSIHEGTEISFILGGEFDVETADGVAAVAKDHVVVIPAGEPHATTARQAGRVAYFLINEIQE